VDFSTASGLTGLLLNLDICVNGLIEGLCIQTEDISFCIIWGGLGRNITFTAPWYREFLPLLLTAWATLQVWGTSTDLCGGEWDSILHVGCQRTGIR
jgi:hypothetical protein